MLHFIAEIVIVKTRIHSSRMRTVRCNGHLGVGGLPGDVCLGGCTPLPCGQTNTRENITFPQILLRAVTNYYKGAYFLVVNTLSKSRPRIRRKVLLFSKNTAFKSNDTFLRSL